MEREQQGKNRMIHTVLDKRTKQKTEEKPSNQASKGTSNRPSSRKKRKTLVKDFEDLAKEGDLDKLKAVFDKCDVNAYGGYYKGNALSYRIPRELLVWLIEQGADIERKDRFDHTPLNYQATLHGDVEYMKWLIELGADVNTKDYMGDTPLHGAAGNADIEKVKCLMEAGANPKIKNHMKHTPLETAIFQCEAASLHDGVETIKYMLCHGAEKTKKAKKLVTGVGEKIEFYRKDIEPGILEEVDAALTELYGIFDVPPVPRRQIHDGKSPITVKAETWQKQHQELWDMLVPGSGSAATVQGEVIRIAGRLSYEILDNGSINWDGDYRKMVDAMKEYLRMGESLAEAEYAELNKIFPVVRKGEGEEELERLTELSVAWVLLNPNPISLGQTKYKR